MAKHAVVNESTTSAFEPQLSVLSSAATRRNTQDGRNNHGVREEGDEGKEGRRERGREGGS